MVFCCKKFLLQMHMVRKTGTKQVESINGTGFCSSKTFPRLLYKDCQLTLTIIHFTTLILSYCCSLNSVLSVILLKLKGWDGTGWEAQME